MSDAARADFRNRAAALAKIAQLQVIDLSQPGDDNLAVTSLDLRDPVALIGRSVTFEAGIRDFGHVARQRQAVDLLVDGRLAGRQYVDIPAGGKVVAGFRQAFESAGDHAVEVRLTGDALKPGDVRGAADALEVDNRRYLAVKVRPSQRVLCIDGRPGGDRRKSSVYTLALALEAQRDPNRRAPIDLEIAPETAVAERDLRPYDCVMLSDVDQFTASEARRLDDYLAHGGSLVFFLGDRVVAENYNRMLAGGASEAGRKILPARLIAVAKNPGDRIDPLDYAHPIVQKYRGQEKAGLLESPVGKYYKVKLTGANAPEPKRAAADQGPRSPEKGGSAGSAAPLSAPAVVVLALSNGDPLIVAQPVRRGRVVLVTTAADMTWGPSGLSLPQWSTYPVLVKEILAWCTAGQAQPRNIAVGDPLESAVAATPSLGTVSIECPDGQRRAAPLEVQGDYSTWRCDDTIISGIYTAWFAAPLSQSQLFAVNVLTAESDLATISREELQSEAWPDVPLNYQTAWQGEGATLPAAFHPAGQLHVSLLYAVVGLLMVESLLAWRFGYNSR